MAVSGTRHPARRLPVPILALATALILSWQIDPHPATLALCVLVAVAGSARSLRRSDPWTAADDLTSLRCAAVVVVTALLLDRETLAFPWPAVLLGAVALAMDGVDGQVARRRGTTRAGARFDEDVDALFVLILSIALVPVWGVWCLIPGVLHYAFRLTGRVRTAWRRRLPALFSRKVIAAMQGILLLAAGTSSAVGIPPLGITCAAAAVVSLLVSFGRDIAWLERHGAVRERRSAPVRTLD
ncbi:CDP-alcohol phosphatidyltransferase family protein [Micrococcus terreus]|uniref:Phosphatidylglycerophosphate synthase n=1 Tax=Micrococcus terreus TaxID=574650 RepID=A0A1I7MJ20_9MICC|nr:CDP-alcohol phosphatidyltransferase family protein [Micrococcus terreus]SFV21928.1 Phosphatidylglycerophosphate synthase [Micrococcus terreus]